MKKAIIVLSCLCMLLHGRLLAQKTLVFSGSIEFDKSINMYAIIKKSWFGDWAKSYQSSIDRYKQAAQPQFKILKSTLVFSGDKTLFTPKKPAEPDRYVSSYIDSKGLVDQNNTVFTDLATNNVAIEKLVFEETFLVKDSTRRISWKITDETREIAGYTCRRANGLMMDSIYVVAFYTGEIPVSGGPESFSGLPGMILGVALPHENMTWFATQVIPGTVASASLQPPAPKKAKIVTVSGLKTAIMGSSYVKQWGKEYLQLYMKGFML